jgi:hypothetical protein
MIERFMGGIALMIALTTGAIPTLAAPTRVTVGANVMISRDRPETEHFEAVICSSLHDPDKMIAASMASDRGAEMDGQIVYVSSDGGRSWHYSFDTFKIGAVTGDASCAAGPDGSLHFGTMLITGSGPTPNRQTRLLDYRSSDAGQSWDAPVTLPGTYGAIRQFNVFDTTRGPFRGRYYTNYNIGINLQTIQGEQWNGAVALSHSGDDGKTWDLPALRAKTSTQNVTHAFDYEGGNSVVFPDGLVMTPLIEQHGDDFQNAKIFVVSSHDGGETLSAGTLVSVIHRVPWAPMHPIMAVTPDGSFKGRVYIVWHDGQSGRARILASYSPDEGNTWSAPKVVSDSPLLDPADPRKGLDATLPYICVTSTGLVGVIWEARRSMHEGFGYDIRFSASLDGGETWSPSVLVSQTTTVPRVHWSRAAAAGDVTGAVLDWDGNDIRGGDLLWMDVDTRGTFHPVWVGNSTGVRQIWTAPVNVQGAVVAPGRVPIDGLSVAGRAVDVEFVSRGYQYDPKSGTVTVDVRLRNRSTVTLHPPLILRVSDLFTRAAEDVRVKNSENDESSRDARWDFSALLPAHGLEPNEVTAPKHLVLEIQGPPELTPDLESADGYPLIHMNLQVWIRGELPSPPQTSVPASDVDDD